MYPCPCIKIIHVRTLFCHFRHWDHDAATSITYGCENNHIPRYHADTRSSQTSRACMPVPYGRRFDRFAKDGTLRLQMAYESPYPLFAPSRTFKPEKLIHTP